MTSFGCPTYNTPDALTPRASAGSDQAATGVSVTASSTVMRVPDATYSRSPLGSNDTDAGPALGPNAPTRRTVRFVGSRAATAPLAAATTCNRLPLFERAIACV